MARHWGQATWLLISPVPNLVPNFLDLAPTVGKSQTNPLAGSAKAQSYQNVNLLHGHSPLLPAFKKTSRGSKTYVDSYGTTHVSCHRW